MHDAPDPVTATAPAHRHKGLPLSVVLFELAHEDIMAMVHQAMQLGLHAPRAALTQGIRQIAQDLLGNEAAAPGLLKRTFGRPQIDEALWAFAVSTTRQPGARHAPLCFVSAGLFSADINTLYEAVQCPVWVSMATRGDFTDYQGRSTVDDRPNWRFEAVPGGALPYFEDLPGFAQRLDAFWRG